MIRLALVYFASEKRSYVIPVGDVIDLPSPKSVKDFDPEKLYTIRWKVLRRENSNTSESAYEGRVLLLAASPESLIAQAAQCKPPIRLPSAFLANHYKEKSRNPKGSSGSTKNVDLVKMSGAASKRVRRTVVAAMEKSSKEQMLQLAATQQLVATPAKSHDTSDTAASPDDDWESQLFPDINEQKNAKSALCSDKIIHDNDPTEKKNIIPHDVGHVNLQKKLTAIVNKQYDNYGRKLSNDSENVSAEKKETNLQKKYSNDVKSMNLQKGLPGVSKTHDKNDGSEISDDSDNVSVEKRDTNPQTKSSNDAKGMNLQMGLPGVSKTHDKNDGSEISDDSENVPSGKNYTIPRKRSPVDAEDRNLKKGLSSSHQKQDNNHGSEISDDQKNVCYEKNDTSPRKRPSSDDVFGMTLTLQKRHCRKSQKSYNDESDVSDDSSNSFKIVEAKLKKQINDQDQLISSLKVELSKERRRARIAETDLNSCRLRLKAWSEAFECFKIKVTTGAASPAPFSPYLPASESKHSGKTTPRVEEWLISSPMADSSKGAGRRRLFEEDVPVALKTTPKSPKKKIIPPFEVSVTKDSKASDSNVVSTPEKDKPCTKSPKSPKKSLQKNSKKRKNLKYSSAAALGAHEKTNKELAPKSGSAASLNTGALGKDKLASRE